MTRSKTWDRLDGETPAPWAAFVVFRDMPLPRTLEALRPLTASLQPPEGYAYDTLKCWSYQWAWAERVKDYDAHIDARKQKAAVRAAESIAARHARQQREVSDLALEVARKKFKALLGQTVGKRKGSGQFDDVNVNAHAAARLLKEAAHLQRLIDGEVTERTEDKSPFEGLSATQLQQIAEWLDEAKDK